MSVKQLFTRNFRNLKSKKIVFNPSLNFIIGDNGSGKSSLLEALFLVGHGKSFRTTKSESMCCFSNDEFVVNVKDEEDSSFGLSKSKQEAGFLIKHNGESLSRLSDLAQNFAVQIVTPESFKLFLCGAKERRKFFDLGLFHVKHHFIEQWKLFSKLLKQRNACLRTKQDNDTTEYWTQSFIEQSELLSRIREDYCRLFESELSNWLKILLPEFDSSFRLNYYRGWNKAKDLKEVLASNREREFKQGFSYAGAQKYDVKFLVDDIPLELKLSRGQQKLFLLALTFTQTKLIEQVKPVKPILLIDDIGAELDFGSRQRFKKAIEQLDCQIVITAIDDQALKPLVENNYNNTMFHVKHGEISELSK